MYQMQRGDGNRSRARALPSDDQFQSREFERENLQVTNFRGFGRLTACYRSRVGTEQRDHHPGHRERDYLGHPRYGQQHDGENGGAEPNRAPRFDRAGDGSCQQRCRRRQVIRSDRHKDSREQGRCRIGSEFRDPPRRPGQIETQQPGERRVCRVGVGVPDASASSSADSTGPLPPAAGQPPPGGASRSEQPDARRARSGTRHVRV